MVTRRGVETAVLVSIEEWKRLQGSARPGLKEILLDPKGPRFEELAVPRDWIQGKSPVIFE